MREFVKDPEKGIIIVVKEVNYNNHTINDKNNYVYSSIDYFIQELKNKYKEVDESMFNLFYKKINEENHYTFDLVKEINYKSERTTFYVINLRPNNLTTYQVNQVNNILEKLNQELDTEKRINQLNRKPKEEYSKNKIGFILPDEI
jgi:predicted amidophosphoribosyltransferase